VEQVQSNGGNQTFPVLPAGYATRDVSGNANVVLKSNEGICDFIELTGVLTGNIVVTIPTPPIAQVVGTSPNAPLKVAPSWLKFVRNSTTGAFTITLVGPGGGGVLLASGVTPCYSKDGQNVQFAAGEGQFVQTINAAPFAGVNPLVMAASAPISKKSSGNVRITAMACPVRSNNGAGVTLTILRDSVILPAERETSAGTNAGAHEPIPLVWIDTLPDALPHTYSMSILASAGTLSDDAFHVVLIVEELP
jgi:hypothetical protein